MGSSTHRPLVLVVEDEAIIAMGIEDDLSDAGYNIAGPFSTSAEARSWLASAKPAVAILDTILRDGRCTELAEELQRRGVPFVVYSGQNQRDKERLPAFEGAPWIEKPAAHNEVLKVVAALAKSGSYGEAFTGGSRLR